MTKEEKWMKMRIGMITASELSQIMSASGKITDGVLSYIRSKRWERRHGFTHPVYSRAMEIGNEQEPMIYEWSKANLGLNEIVYSKELNEIPFWVAPDCPLGASPDAFVPSQRLVIEYKTLVSPTAIEFFGDEYTSYEEKKLAVAKEHLDQLCGQFISNPIVEEIWLVKYIYPDDEIIYDQDSPLAKWRGLVFKFARKDYVSSIDAVRNRVILIDKMIDAPINPSEFKTGEWYVESDKLCKK